jgi:hypothetical protein
MTHWCVWRDTPNILCKMSTELICDWNHHWFFVSIVKWQWSLTFWFETEWISALRVVALCYWILCELTIGADFGEFNVRAMTHWHVCHDSLLCGWLIDVCVMTHWYVCHDSLTCVPWLIDMCAMTYWRVWRDTLNVLCKMTIELTFENVFSSAKHESTSFNNGRLVQKEFSGWV